MLLILSPSLASILVSSDSLLKQVFQSVSVIISDESLEGPRVQVEHVDACLAKGLHFQVGEVIEASGVRVVVSLTIDLNGQLGGGNIEIGLE